MLRASKAKAQAPVYSTTASFRCASMFDKKGTGYLLKTDCTRGYLKATQVDQAVVAKDVSIDITRTIREIYELTEKAKDNLQATLASIRKDKDIPEGDKARAMKEAGQKAISDNKASCMISVVRKCLDTFTNNSDVTWTFSHVDKMVGANGNNFPLNLSHAQRLIELLEDKQLLKDQGLLNDPYDITAMPILAHLATYFQVYLDLAMTLWTTIATLKWGMKESELNNFLNHIILCSGRMETNDPSAPVFISPMFAFNSEVDVEEVDSEGNTKMVCKRMFVPLFSQIKELEGVHFKFVSIPSEQMGLAHVIRQLGRDKGDMKEVCEALVKHEKLLSAYAPLLLTAPKVSWKAQPVSGRSSDCYFTVVGATMQHQNRPSGSKHTMFKQIETLWSLHGLAVNGTQTLFVNAWKSLVQRTRAKKDEDAREVERALSVKGGKKDAKAADATPRLTKSGKLPKPEGVSCQLNHADMQKANKAIQEKARADKAQQVEDDLMKGNVDSFDEMVRMQYEALDKSTPLEDAMKLKLADECREGMKTAMRKAMADLKELRTIQIRNGLKLAAQAKEDMVDKKTLDITKVAGYVVPPVVPSNLEIYLEARALFIARMNKEITLSSNAKVEARLKDCTTKAGRKAIRKETPIVNANEVYDFQLKYWQEEAAKDLAAQSTNKKKRKAAAAQVEVKKVEEKVVEDAAPAALGVAADEWAAFKAWQAAREAGAVGVAVDNTDARTVVNGMAEGNNLPHGIRNADSEDGDSSVGHGSQVLSDDEDDALVKIGEEDGAAAGDDEEEAPAKPAEAPAKAGKRRCRSPPPPAPAPKKRLGLGAHAEGGEFEHPTSQPGSDEEEGGMRTPRTPSGGPPPPPYPPSH